MRITLPASLARAIEDYLDTDWDSGPDPSKLGALNSVSFIGERVAAIYAFRRRRK